MISTFLHATRMLPYGYFDTFLYETFLYISRVIYHKMFFTTSFILRYIKSRISHNDIN